MKYSLSILVLCTGLLLSSCETLNQTAKVLNQSLGTPTSTEIALGLKQALEVGTNTSAERLNAKDGFLGNMAIKILFPPEAKKAENTLRSLGLNQLCDNVITSLNRAAENAAAEAKPIFISAIKQMTIADATNILLGKQNDAATQYFKRVTNAQLTEKFKPVIQSSLGKVGATKYWGDVVSRYNQIPLVTDINPDLTAYVTQKAIEGLFVQIAQEELNIRQNFSARSTSLLQKVFGYADRQR
ncbi:uncharacterized protein DUF4197 [Arcticibacter tournemirensis]|uniref:DUF4197 domain-containing protein n=1 Tax=Arcticibacter tournemirensis TaxID=699437 RepID=A0A4Q0MFU4_9SPHI|nr:DUF4197 domain-containing protein [Arcticibacter tournemirensis]KAA8485502.1 DUF4197 domain-containing protein [Arcticibacter tournemirensis]RXF71776.1 DUF4197 domain-containing protein [Arcticibacter tournemirensis]TQM48792.1 uncharacterized protein DUF4197 [Arcticibacter tournemirensis]